MLEQEKVFKLIESRRLYQDAKWGTITEHNQSIEGFLLVLEKKVNDARQAWYSGGNILSEVLDVAAVATACLEQYDSIPA